MYLYQVIDLRSGSVSDAYTLEDLTPHIENSFSDYDTNEIIAWLRDGHTVTLMADDFVIDPAFFVPQPHAMAV